MHSPTRSALPLLASLALGAACATSGLEPRPRPHPSAPEPGPREPLGLPAWDGAPVSWRKLGAIESWLDGAGRRARPEAVAEAELQLAEGRLTLARRERAGIPARLLSSRIEAARAGFQRALATHALDLDQRLRARRGLSEAERLQGGVDDGLEVGVQSRSAWGAAPPVLARLNRTPRPWSRITVHHSGRSSAELGSAGTAQVADALRRIQTVHVRDRGWGDIGYHFLIDPRGRIWEGRPLAWQGAHSAGDNNIANIGICLLGDFDHERPTPQALASLERLVGSLRARYGIASDQVWGHDHFKATDCPGRGLSAWVQNYRARARTPRPAQ